MDEITSWLAAPADAYRVWQHTEAAGADGRPFSARSIVQHAAMFDNFLRHLAGREETLVDFGPAAIETFFAKLEKQSAPGTTTRLRYAKLLDRVCRHLVQIGARQANPAFDYARRELWPDTEPDPVFLDEQADARLQDYVQPEATDGRVETRNRALVALLSGTGITSAEIRDIEIGHLYTEGPRPDVWLPKHGRRMERRIPLPAFALPVLSLYLAKFADKEPNARLFPAPRTGKAMSDMTLLKIVRPALEAIDFHAPDMSPRVLRNTFARRQLIAGQTNEQVSGLLGLVSDRTVVRLRATIGIAGGEQS